MEEKGIEFRRGSSGGGNQLRQPYLKKLLPEKEYEKYPEVEHIHFFAYYIGNYPSLEKEKILHSICLNGENVEIIAMMTNDEILAYAQDGDINQINIKNGKIIKSIKLYKRQFFCDIKVFDDGSTAVAIHGNYVILFDINTEKIITQTNLDRYLRSVCILPKSNIFIVGDDIGNLFRMKYVI